MGVRILLFRISDSWIDVDIKSLNVIDEIKPQRQVVTLKNPQQDAVSVLSSPLGTPPLESMLKGADRVLVILNDITRLTPYSYMLPAIMGVLEDVHVDFLVANGTHRASTDDEMLRMYGRQLLGHFKVENHDCDNSEFIYCCTTKNDNDIYLNRMVERADVIVSTGVIGFHYFAGYSGGRKSLLPGIAERGSISKNHALMVRRGATTANIKCNPVNDEMMDVARAFTERLFIFNAVTSPHGDVLGFLAGSYKDAWLEGVKLYDHYFKVRIEEPADVVIADAGGYPKDINMYQTQKALDNALKAVRYGGTVILIAGCGEGFGNRVFEEWIRDARRPEDVIQRLKGGFVLGAHKAYAVATAVKKADVILVSHMRPEDVTAMFFRYAPDIDTAIGIAKEKHGSGFSVILFPDATNLLPVLEG